MIKKRNMRKEQYMTKLETLFLRKRRKSLKNLREKPIMGMSSRRMK